MRRSLILLLSIVAGCSEGGDPAPDFAAHPVTITPNPLWAGATVTLRSAAFGDADPAALALTLDGVAVVSQVIDDTTLTIVVPAATARGDHHLFTSVNGSPDELGGLHVYGWAGTTSGATPIYTDMVPWPVDVPTGVLVGGLPTGRVPTYIPADPEGSVISYPGLEVNDNYGPSTSYLPGVLIDRTGLVAQLHALDSGWVLLDSTSTSTRNLYQLSPAVWLRTGNHWSNFLADSNMRSFGATLMTESPWLLVRSLSTDRATFVVSAATPELQILNTSDGSVTATVPGIVGNVAAAFTPNGASLFLSGSPSWNGPFAVLRVDPTNGAILAKDSVHLGAWNLATHSAHPGLLFELNTAADDTWILRIRNDSDLTIVAELGSATPDESCPGSFAALIVTASTARAMINRCNNGYQVVRWDLMPGI